MNINEISETLKSIIKNTAEKLSGFKRRTYIAEITIELLDKSTRKAEREFGWGRKTVEKGMMELTTGIRWVLPHFLKWIRFFIHGIFLGVENR